MNAHPSFELVTHLLLLEEPTPSGDALRRWQDRYPQYRDSLAEFFATWVRQETPQHPAPEIDEDALVEKGVAYAMEAFRRQGRVIPKDSVVRLQPFDQLVMAAVVQLHGAGHMARITRTVSEMSGRRVMLASTYQSLRRLEHWKLVETRYANPETEPQNEGRQYFLATMAGERALADAKATATEGAVAEGFSGDAI
jgi:hypothetical protein